MNKIKDWLSPPIFEGDAEKTRLARIGNAIVLAVITVLGIYTFARPKLFLENTEAAIANAILLLLLISQLFVIRRGWVRAATLTLAVLVWSNLTVQIWLFGGVRDAGFAAYLLIILAASLVLGWRAATLFLLLSILAGLGMAHAEAVGTLPFEPDGPYALWLDHSVNFIIATILVTVMVADLNQSLARARHNEQTLAERNSELRAIQTQLETQMAEREQAEQKLRASEKLYRQTVDNSPNPIFSVDRSGCILTWNPACESLFQYGHDRIGQSYHDILWDDAVCLTVKNWLHEVFEQGRSLSGVEITYRCKHGAPLATVSRLYPAFNPEGQVGACIFANTDITERVRMEVALRESEEKYRQLVKHAPAGIYEVDLTNHRFTDVNDVMCEQTGYSKDEFLALSPHHLLTEDSREQFLVRSEKLHAGEEVPETVEYKFRSKDGQEFWVLVNTRVVNENGQPARATVIAHNITDRKQAEAALKQSEERHRLVVENANEAIVVAQDGQLKFFNSKLMEFTGGYSREEMQYTPFTEFVHPDDRAMVLDRHVKRLKNEECPQVYAFRVLDKDGKVTWVEINAIHISWEEKPAVLFFLSDITERKQAEAELEMYRSHLEELVTERTAELTNVNLQLQTEITEREQAEQALTESHERLLTILDGIDADIYVADMASYEILFVNKHMQNCFGQRLVGHVCWQAFRGESGPCAYCTNDKLVDPEGKSTGVHVWEGHNPIIGKWTMNYDRAIRWVDGRWVSLQIGMDITDRKQAEEQIKTSLKEKEVLLQEIHHRVKNNLQVVSSLLSLQSGYIKDKQVLNVFQDSQNRVQSMALIHEKLYRSENLAHIDFAEYIRELIGFLLEAQNGPSQGITCTIQADPVYLNIDMAVPCGLILNELVSNSLKHAFPDSRPGEIRIELNADRSPQLILMVSDNGVGFSNDVDFYNTASLGLNLVNTLVNQLGATIEVNHEAGTEIKLRFSYPGTRV